MLSVIVSDSRCNKEKRTALLDFCLNTNVIKDEYIFKSLKERHLCALLGTIRHTTIMLKLHRGIPHRGWHERKTALSNFIWTTSRIVHKYMHGNLR